MNFQLDKSQKEIQKAVREFARGEFDKDFAQKNDKAGSFPVEIWENAAELGFIGIHFPEELGGGGMGTLENAFIAEEFCKNDSTIGAAVMFSGFASEYLLHFGDDAQKKKYLPEMVEGWTAAGAPLALSVGAGGQLPLAEKKAGGWWVSGEIDYVMNSQNGKFYCIPCITSGENDRPAGASIFLIDRGTAGVSFEKRAETVGLRMNSMATMRLENAFVPEKNLIGNENGGEKQTERVKGVLRVQIAAMALGIARGAMERSLSYVKQREQFGRKIGVFQVTRHKLAEMAVKIEQARFLTYSAAAGLDTRKPDFTLGAMAKLSATRTALDVCREAVQLLGGYGFMTEYDVERFYRDAKTLQLICGNTRNLNDTVAKNVIGKIR